MTLVFIGTLTALLLGELIVRICGYKPLFLNRESVVFWEYDANLGWRHRAGKSGIFRKPQFRVTVEINSRGLRDRDYEYARQPGRDRVLVLGDSFVWGFGVEQDEVFTEVLERSLPNTDVINAGVSGYGTDQQLLWLNSEGVRYQPDTIILVVSGNDPLENTVDFAFGKYYKPVFTWKQGVLTRQNEPVPTPSWIVQRAYHVRRFSALANLITQHAVRWELSSRRNSGRLPSLRGVQAQPVRLTLELCRKIKERASRMQCRLLVMTTNTFWVNHGTATYEGFVGDLRRLGVPVIDLNGLPNYDAAVLEIQGDSHWNAAGHRFVAKEIQRRWFSKVDG